MAQPMQSLMDTARVFLRTAREELQEGLDSNNWVKIRDGSEKAWNAVLQATDHAMQVRGRTRCPVGTLIGIASTSSISSAGTTSRSGTRTSRSDSTEIPSTKA